MSPVSSRGTGNHRFPYAGNNAWSVSIRLKPFRALFAALSSVGGLSHGPHTTGPGAVIPRDAPNNPSDQPIP